MDKIVNKNLALYGGPKIRKNPMPPRRAFNNDELKAVEKVFQYYDEKNIDFGFQGEFERRYTDAFIHYQSGVGFADAVCSGTAALFVSLSALRLPAGSHVIVSPVTDPGTISAIILNQLVPVLTDSDPFSYNMGVEHFEKRITDKTRAVIVVHLGGKAAKVEQIGILAKTKGIYVIEDCSQAHGAKLNGQKVGTFGDISAFSTMYRKIHATGGCGGIIFTKDKNLYNLARAFADRGKPFFKEDFNEKEPSSFLFPALNLNIDELSCAIGIKSLEKLDHTINRRLSFLQELNSSLARLSKVCRLAPVSIEDSPFFQLINIDISRISCSKTEFAKAVRAEGIEINPDYRYVVCEWEWVKPYLADSFESKNAIHYRENSFNLLFNENYGDQEVKDIVSAILKVENAFVVE